MKWSLDSENLAGHVAHQLGFLTRYVDRFSASRIARYLPETQDRIQKCFSEIKKKYYEAKGEPVFDHSHGDHYAVFLYFLGNTIYRANQDADLMLATFSLNKMMHGLDAYPSIQLPDVFMLVHPVGTVLGRAKYSNYFVAYQGVTVGSTEDGLYPEFSEGVVLFSGASVIGRCQVGSDVVFGANSSVITSNIPPASIVVGAYPQHRCFPASQTVRERFFDDSK